MAQLAIKGHATRGSEVIALLEMLGGKNIHNYDGTFNECYIIDNNKICTIYTSVAKIDDYVIITLEDFLEKYPYKVGDKVMLDRCLCTITGMSWDCDDVIYYVKGANFSKGVYSKDKDLKLYKEETIKDMAEKDKAKAPTLNGEDYSGKRFGYKIPDGYEFDTIYNNEIILKPIKPQYPRTFKECCDVVNASSNVALVYCKFNGQTYSYDIDNLQIYENLRKLKICRDAYWKIAGEQMGLDKPWEPDWESYKDNFCIITYKNNPIRYEIQYRNRILAFPTEEMRDAFYENFKELIEECKELL